MSETLYETTLRLLKAKPAEVSLSMLARSIGKPPQWLSALSRGEIDNPGVKTIQKLHDALKLMSGDANV